MDDNNNINENNKNNDPLSTPFSGGKERYNSRTTNTDLKKNNRPLGNSVKPPNSGNLGRRGLPNLFNKGYRGNNGGIPKTNNNVNKAVNSLNSFSNRMAGINNVFRRIGQVNEDHPPSALEDTVKDGVKNIVKKVPLNVKLIAVACICGFLFFLIIVASLFGVDSEDFDVSSDYSYTVGNTKYWWPVAGSSDVSIDTSDPTDVVVCKNCHFMFRWGRDHTGVDLHGGSNIIAAMDGVVEEANDGCNVGIKHCGKYWGNYVIIKHSNGTYTGYAHMVNGSIKVKKGEKVKQGQVLGKMGNTGDSTGRHLHFEIRIGVNNRTAAVDPLTYIDPNNPRPISEEANVVNSKKITIPEDATNIQRVCLVFKAEGYPDEAIAGIIGNMQAESSSVVDPTAVNEINCVGIVQWCDIPPTTYRKTNLMNAYGSSWSNLDNQINFVLQELNGMPTVKNYLMEDHTPEEHADKFCYKYEIPGEKVCKASTRRNNARGVYDFVQNGCSEVNNE